jgi:outer membrane protein OmpA-like peptidoglycan-associated protein
MSKKILYSVGILLTMIIGSILYMSYCCDCSKQNAKIDEAQVVIPAEQPVKEEVQASIPPAEPAKPDYSALKEKINVNPLTFYFNANQSGISLTDQEKAKIADIITYLEKVTDASVIVTGYTDNSGSREKNLKLGQDRAEFIKSYLVKNGVSESKITTASKGPDGAVADNETPEGKAKNRRTIVLIN